HSSSRARPIRDRSLSRDLGVKTAILPHGPLTALPDLRLSCLLERLALLGCSRCSKAALSSGESSAYSMSPSSRSSLFLPPFVMEKLVATSVRLELGGNVKILSPSSL